MVHFRFDYFTQLSTLRSLYFDSVLKIFKDTLQGTAMCILFLWSLIPMSGRLDLIFPSVCIVKYHKIVTGRISITEFE